YDFAVIQGLYARAGTPREIVDRIASEVGVIVKEPEVIAQFDKIGAEAAAESGADYFARILKDEADRVARAVAAAGRKPPWYGPGGRRPEAPSTETRSGAPAALSLRGCAAAGRSPHFVTHYSLWGCDFHKRANVRRGHKIFEVLDAIARLKSNLSAHDAKQ